MKFNSYWLNIAKKELEWDKIPKVTLDKSKFNFQWFTDGKINVAKNCLYTDLHKKNFSKLAIVYYDKNKKRHTLTYKELLKLVSNFSLLLKNNFKIGPNSNVVIHGSASIETAVAMLSCANIGATHTVLFEDLEAPAIKKRLELAKPNLIISRANEMEFKKKFNKIEKNIKILLFNKKKSQSKKIYNFNINNLKYIQNLDKKFEFFQSNHPLFNLFTSGTTGEPKGVQHSSGGYLLYSKYTCKKKFGLNINKKILTASDAGWINGHTYALYGPLSICATTILIEQPSMLLDLSFLKKILNYEKVDILYLPVTLVRLIKALSRNIKFQSKYLKTIGTMGEPLAKDVGKWFMKNFLKNDSKQTIINTYFQTETGGIICSPSFSKNSSPGSVGLPINKYLGVFIDKNKHIKIKNHWPGCMQDVLNGPSYYKRYFDKSRSFQLYDYAKKAKEFWVFGRNDDVVNIRGHRIGSAEIESTILKIKNIIEACVFSVPNELEGNEIVIVVAIKKNTTNNKKMINNIIVKNFGNFALPKEIIILNSLPKTRSGKILRKILKKIYLDAKCEIKDLSTILNKKDLIEFKRIIIKSNY